MFDAKIAKAKLDTPPLLLLKKVPAPDNHDLLFKHSFRMGEVSCLNAMHTCQINHVTTGRFFCLSICV